jgi:hypothetical protein
MRIAVFEALTIPIVGILGFTSYSLVGGNQTLLNVSEDHTASIFTEEVSLGGKVMNYVGKMRGQGAQQ